MGVAPSQASYIFPTDPISSLCPLPVAQTRSSEKDATSLIASIRPQLLITEHGNGKTTKKIREFEVKLEK